MNVLLKCASWAAIILCLTGCGVPGLPRPPSLNLPQPVSDLSAIRKGEKVYLAWTVPTETTDAQRVRHLGVTKICRSAKAASPDCSNPAATVEPPAAAEPNGKKSAAPNMRVTARYTDKLPPGMPGGDPAAEVFYAVSVLNQNGRSAGLSNKVAVPAATAVKPPADFAAQVTADGIVLHWTAAAHTYETPELHYLYRVYRREVGTKTDAIAGEVAFGTSPTYSMVDHDFEWEKSYDYRATVVDVIDVKDRPETKFEGDDTAPIRVFAHDIFPPAVPSGLQAVFSGVGQQTFIDLIWTPDSEPDLAGYNVYRREADKPEQKLNSEPVKAPAFRDGNVTSGHTYIYSVTAVDIRANESAHSGEASESVP